MKRKKTTGIFAVCYMAYLFIYVARLNFSMAASGLKDCGLLTMEQVGYLGSIFSVVYACGRLLSGILSDRNPPWKMICTGLVLCGVSNVCFGFFPAFPALVLLWGVNAFAQSMLWGSILRILSAIYPERIAKKMASYMATTVAAGNLVGILLNTELINRFGLAFAFLIPGGITLILSFFVLLNTRQVQPPAVQARSGKFFDLVRLPNVKGMLFPAMVHGILKDNVSLWMAVYIMDTFGVDLEQSSYYILLIPMVGFLARILAPELYRMAGEKDKPVLKLGFVFCTLGALALTFLTSSAWVAIVYLSLVYFSVSVMNGCFLSFFPMQFARDGYVASVSGIMDFAAYLGNGISSAVFGVLIAAYGYNAMFLSWAVLCILGLAALFYRKKS
jgi:OPA family glycerol-3-phosphate transporter-like MFS transporter